MWAWLETPLVMERKRRCVSKSTDPTAAGPASTTSADATDGSVIGGS